MTSCSTTGSGAAGATIRRWSCSSILIARPRPTTSRSCGGIDLARGRNDDSAHDGDPQADRSTPEVRQRPPWHDVQLEVRGPAVGDLELTFRERWDDPTPLDRPPRRGACSGPAREPDHRPRSAATLPDPPEAVPTPCRCCGPIRPTAAATRSHPTASAASRGVPQGVRRARRLIYIEDQYLWATDAPSVLAAALPPTRAARDRRGPPLSRPDGRFSGRQPLGREPRCGILAAAGGPVRRLRPRERATAPRSTCTRRSASSTTSGWPSAPTTSTAVPGRTTRSSPARSSTRPRDEREPPTRPVSATAHEVRPRDLRLRLARRAPRTRRVGGRRSRRSGRLLRSGPRPRRATRRLPHRPDERAPVPSATCASTFPSTSARSPAPVPPCALGDTRSRRPSAAGCVGTATMEVARS